MGLTISCLVLQEVRMNPKRASGSFRINNGDDRLLEAAPVSLIKRFMGRGKNCIFPLPPMCARLPLDVPRRNSLRSTEAAMLPGGRLSSLRRSANNSQPGVCLSVGAGIVAPIEMMAGA